jgi:hypothetical protein
MPESRHRFSLPPCVHLFEYQSLIILSIVVNNGLLSIQKAFERQRNGTMLEGELTGYVNYPGSDCLKGAVLKVADGHRLMRNISSHHCERTHPPHPLLFSIKRRSRQSSSCAWLGNG